MALRRGVGVGAVTNRRSTETKFEQTAKLIEEKEITHVQEQLKNFRTALQVVGLHSLFKSYLVSTSRILLRSIRAR